MPANPLLALVVAALGVAAPTADDKPDLAALSKLIQQTVTAHLPKQYEDRSEWGSTTPIDPFLRFQGRRQRVMVNGREEWPHGTWKRMKLWLDDPAKDVRIEVRDLHRLDDGKLRLSVAATVAGHAERERKRWRNGIPLLGVSVQADGVVTMTLDCDVAIAVNAAKFPPEVTVEPKVAACRLELKEFELRRVGPVEVEVSRELGDELKQVVAGLVKVYEPKAQELANRAIAKVLKEGKGKLSAAELLKALPARPMSP